MYSSCTSSNENTGKPNAAFSNTRWVLRALNDKKIYTPEGGKEIFITFTSDKNAVKGFGGCNNFFGTFVREKSNLTIGPVARTEMYCEGTMANEDAFMKALEVTVKYKIKGDELFLYQGDKLLAKLEAVYL